MVKGLIASLVAAAVGAAAWAAIAYFAHRELGILAWGVGLLVGFAMALGVGAKATPASGVLAAVVAVLSIVGGKYAAAYFVVQHEVAGLTSGGQKITDHDVKIQIADEIVHEREAAGKRVEFPRGLTMETAEKKEDYPSDIWNETEQRWKDLTPAERQDAIRSLEDFRRTVLTLHGSDIRNAMFRDSFSPFDLLWVFLAVVSAYRLGAQGRGESAPGPTPA